MENVPAHREESAIASTVDIWQHRLGAFYGILLSMTFAVLIAGQLTFVNVDKDKWGEHGTKIWAILAVLAAVVAADNWYNYFLNEPRFEEANVGIPVALTLVAQICYSFFPFFFLLSVRPTNLSPTLLFAINLVVVSIIDMVGKWKQADSAVTNEDRKDHTRLLISRIAIAAVLVFYIGILIAKPWNSTLFGRSVDTSRLFTTVPLLLWIPFRVLDHVLRRSKVRRNQLPQTSPPAP